MATYLHTSTCHYKLVSMLVDKTISRTPDIILKIWWVFLFALISLQCARLWILWITVVTLHGRVGAWQNMRCKHAFRPISAGFAAIQLGIQGLDQLILYTIFYFHKFFNFSQTNFVYKVHLRILNRAATRWPSTNNTQCTWQLFLGQKVTHCMPENTVLLLHKQTGAICKLAKFK
jgi:hypothetical protein